MTETTSSKVEKWSYPLKVGTAEATDPQQYYQALAKAKDGYYPLGANGLWHGGVHFDEATGLVGDLTEVRCIADGEVVAYRIDEAYPKSDYGSTQAVYSTGFVLVKHRLEVPSPPAPKAVPGAPPTPAAAPMPSLTFFSLYMHLLDWEGYKANPSLARPGFWGKGLYQVKANLNTKSLGLRVRSAESGQSAVLTVLPRGTTVVTKPAVATKKWLEIVSVTPEVAGLAPNTGWVFKGEMVHLGGDRYFIGEGAKDVPQNQTSGANVRDATSKGLPIAFLPSGTQVKISDDQAEKKYRKLIEIVSGQSVPAMRLDADGKLPGFVWLDDLEGKSQPHTPMGRVVALDSPYKVKAGEVLGHVGKYQNHSDAVAKNLLHLEIFSCEDVKNFTELSASKAAGLSKEQKTLVKIPKDTKLVTDTHSISSASPPKAGDAGRTVGSDFFIPLGALEALPAEDKIKESVVMSNSRSTTYWWHLKGLLRDDSGNNIDGWFAEPDIALSRHSPFEWNGFAFIEETVSNIDLFAAYLHRQKSFNDQDRETYVPNVESAVAGSVNERLYEILDSNKDKRLSKSEIVEALSKPWFSQEISHIVTRYENEWDYKKERWDSLDDIMGHSESDPNKSWVEEKLRIEKLSFWGSLIGQHGITSNANVQHIHPVGLISMFLDGGECSCPATITKEHIKLIAPLTTQENIDKYTDLLTGMYEKAKIVTCISKVHVLAQMLHESGSLRLTVEGVNAGNPPSYSPYIGRGLIQITYKVNYEKYGEYVGENFVGAPDYNKMAQLPHSVISVGWYWSEFKNLTVHSDRDDFIYCTALVNGGFNGYDDRLQYLNLAIKTLDIQNCAKLNKLGVYELSDSKAYNKAKFSFAWGLWSDPAGGKHGKQSNQSQALIGYKRFLELYEADPSIEANTKTTYYASGRYAVQAKAFAEARIIALGGNI